MIIPFQIPVGDTLVIRGDIHAPEADGRKQPLLLFCHGFKGFKDWGCFPYAAEAWARRGIATIRFNFSCNGVGESLTQFDELEKFAVNTYARELADLAALVNWISEHSLPIPGNIDKSQLFIAGHSKGGGDTILFGAGHPQVKGVITWNGIADVNLFDDTLRKEIAENGVGYIPNARTGQMMPISRAVIDDVDRNREAYDLVAKVAQMEQPLLIVQGKKDAQRLVKGAERLHAAARNSRLHWIADGDHTWNTKHPFAGTTPQLEEAIEVTARFIHEHAG
ncbi:alpha/beta hydrolase [Brevibacillus sp. SYP-B805]|uniref:alpha/beta hydrolase n=1 Tax=Brevibacillus sp. SYP-B805 TaxID=1578199 RepID=UPI0013EB5A28|nr:prolyl oligopeptidase family serine peptidase [Brevibacillus sp. SYP-B805]NGQ96883.1 alpha/beta hydrolase [Brevibacillus sp. SYP-B805]